MTSKNPNGDLGFSAMQTSEGGYVLVGSIGIGNGYAFVIKTDANGKQQWNRTFGGAKTNEAFSIRQTSDKGYIFAGYTRSYGAGESDVWLVKIDTNGNEQWNRTFGGAQSDTANSIQQTSDGGYIVAGDTQSYGAGDTNAWIIKTDANGNQQWNKTFGGAKTDRAYYFKETSDGGYILAGFTESYGAGGRDAWLVKIKESSATAPSLKTTVSDINKSVEKSTPGFEFLVAVAGIILFLLMRKRT